MPLFHVDIDKTDRTYKERLANQTSLAMASAMASSISKGLTSSISRGLSPARSLRGGLVTGEREQLHLIMLVGLIASGKTMLAESVVRAFGGYECVSGDLVEQEAGWEEVWNKW